ncbi:hypothetical protein CDV31_009510 [Fusarium ambrosium]|uniref:Uncharacterized protein n=1 Tax=Fusarium ambrosium TaxID=131363 RepID=A0A428TU49_9HYPO|nr:hypothetical protein CDV31_009510 [Fusarium ambrosium]
MITMNSNFENDQTPPDNVGDSNLSESLADMDLDPGSSSEDKRSRDDSEVAEEETDQSSPPTKRQRREEDDEDDDDEEEVGEDASEQQQQQDVIEEDLDGSQQRPILTDDVDQSEDASQQHEMAQDDAEIGSSLENNVNSSHDDEERDNQEPLPLRPVNTNTNSPNPVADPTASPVINPTTATTPTVSPVAYSDDVSMAEGSMISIDIPPPDPNLPPVEAHLSIAFAASLQELSDAQDYHEEAVTSCFEGYEVVYYYCYSQAGVEDWDP